MSTKFETFDPAALIVRERRITGMSAILLPFNSDRSIDWISFNSHLQRTVEAGLIPAVNMDTGYANLIDESTRLRVLTETRATLPGAEFVAGAFVADETGAAFNGDAYKQQVDSIQRFGGTPIIFQSHGLVEQSDDQIVTSYQTLSRECDRFLAFELGKVFAPFGSIYSLDVYRQLMLIKSCAGAKHSSLQRDLEWQRLIARNETRRDFMVLTGNDLAIDMVMYGSDYLLGLSTFAPDQFARRDALWEQGDSGFHQLNDILQYLGFFAFREPVSAYKHSAAMFLHQRGWITTDLTHPGSDSRPASDHEILQKIMLQLGLDKAG